MENHKNKIKGLNEGMKRILIIDDDRSMSKSIQGLLSSYPNYVIEVTHDGQTAEDILRKRAFDLIILDIKMPGKDGYEVCLNMRNEIDQMKKTKIIGISGYSGGIGAVFMEALGADHYFKKPFNVTKFRMKVAMLLEEN
ncbi:hypothetical protein MNBD_UNCLBAC01-1231 [hydrothermal vent metagenome]|uniref:Response regulatory domain-containing protein n=1 Tax=hydrothermal vent metagenome TaxID=652676 RepID=A0A3B1DFU0_9ZZZZ